ncbi:unnamed protein product [Eruca vesicaria subsp. sativa]|uniref:Pentatricopeptide repeat-containing protein n=1 Tax=Eruca vesicaria subsp. sativa TaxID=29727 RepID=A0ABC8L4B3_ERUVS|nr:unnamed protein product [Eruca vesicaria subsp. sativa]
MELTVCRLAKSNRFSDVEALIESCKKDPQIKTEMEQLGAPRSVVSFNALLTACLHSDLFKRVPHLFDEMPQRYNNITLDKVSYGMLIKSYCDAGSVDKAMESESYGGERCSRAYDGSPEILLLEEDMNFTIHVQLH